MLSLIARPDLNGYLFFLKSVLIMVIPGKEYTSLFNPGNHLSALLEPGYDCF